MNVIPIREGFKAFSNIIHRRIDPIPKFGIEIESRFVTLNSIMLLKFELKGTDSMLRTITRFSYGCSCEHIVLIHYKATWGHVTLPKAFHDKAFISKFKSGSGALQVITSKELSFVWHRDPFENSKKTLLKKITQHRSWPLFVETGNFSSGNRIHNTKNIAF